MTPQEQIAYLRSVYFHEQTRVSQCTLAVCDLAERADDAEAWANELEERFRLTDDVIGFAERLADNVAGNPAEYCLHIYAIPGAQDLLMAVRRLREARLLPDDYADIANDDGDYDRPNQ